MKANTDEMIQIASEIKSLVTEYQVKISKMYKKFAEMPRMTKEWSGNKAEEYVRYVLLDKPDLIRVGIQIKAFAKAIADDAIAVENNAAIVRKDEINEQSSLS